MEALVTTFGIDYLVIMLKLFVAQTQEEKQVVAKQLVDFCEYKLQVFEKEYGSPCDNKDEILKIIEELKEKYEI